MQRKGKNLKAEVRRQKAESGSWVGGPTNHFCLFPFAFCLSSASEGRRKKAKGKSCIHGREKPSFIR
jgi:hypothetical protein